MASSLLDSNLTMNVNTSSDVTNLSTSTAASGSAERSTFEFVVNAIAAPILYGIITLLGIAGNCLVIYVILTRQKLQTVTNILLFNLAVSDLSFVIICPPFTAYQMATKSWPFSGVFGEILCKLMHYSLNVTVYVTIYTLVLISIVRYMTVVRGQQTQRYRTKKNVILTCVGIWIAMLLVNGYLIHYYKVVTYNGVPICDTEGYTFGRMHFIAFFAFAYLLPLLAIAVFSLRILRKIQTSKTTTFQKSNERNRQISRLLIIVVVIFAVFWLPVHIHLICSYWGLMPTNNAYMAVSFLFNGLAYCNSCVNPIIYNYTSKDFRESFREVAFCKRGVKYSDQDHGVEKTEMTVDNGQQHRLLTPQHDADGADTVITDGNHINGKSAQ